MSMLFLAFWLLKYDVTAASPLFWTRQAPAGPSSPTPGTECSYPDDRSVFDIIWGCLSTIFACTWVSVHPNMPRPGSGWFESKGRRAYLMFLAIIAPEMVLFWALRQWLGAKTIAEKYKDHGWTITHGFFIQMGGLRVRGADDETSLSMDTQMLDYFVAVERLDFPKILVDEIKDKSKGDVLAKGIVLIQTFYFIAKCIARGATGLAITELEVVTLAFAALNGVMYFLWWHKPLEAETPMVFHIRPKTVDDDDDDEKSRTSIPSEHAVETSASLHLVSPEHQLSNALELRTTPVDENNLPTSPPINPLSNDVSPEISPGASPIPSDTPQKEAIKPGDVIVTYRSIENRHPEIKSPLRHFLYNITYRPLRALIGSLTNMAIETTIPSDLTHVPSFYAHPPESAYQRLHTILITVFLGITFGGIHLIAWHFHFPTLAERSIWRIIGITLTVLPLTVVLLIMIVVICADAESDEHDMDLVKMYKVGGALIFGAYTIARLILLGLALAALRDLPPSALLDVEWTSFIPHMSSNS